MDGQFEMTGLSSENIEAANNRFGFVLESLCDLARLLAHVITNRNITNPDDLSEYILELTDKQQPLALELLKQVSIRTRKFSG